MSGGYRGIFATDLDGTLMRQGRISGKDLRAFGGLNAHGVLRVIATGRSLRSAQACLPPDFPADYVILSTGSHIVHWPSQTVLHAAALDETAVRRTCVLLTALDMSYMVHDDFPHNHRFAYRRGGTPVEDFERRLALHAGHGRENGCTGGRASQFVAIVDSCGSALHERIVGELPGQSVIRATSPLDGRSVWIEIFAAGVSKAAGIQHIAGHHGLRDVLLGAVGNDHNDRDMLDLADAPYRVDGSHLEDDGRCIALAPTDDTVARAVAHYTKLLHADMKHA